MNISPGDLDIGIGEENRSAGCVPENVLSFRRNANGWRTDELGVGRYLPPCESANSRSFSWFDYRSKGFDDNRGLRIACFSPANRWQNVA